MRKQSIFVEKRCSRWEEEKKQLLQTHSGWFVAYLNDKRVALAPTLSELAQTLEEKFGTPRKPCEFHQITEGPFHRRGPSPRINV